MTHFNHWRACAIATLMMAPCLSSAGEWKQITSAAFMTPDASNTGFNLMVSVNNETKSTRANFVGQSHSLCRTEPNGDQGAIGPYKVNGKFVNFWGVCTQGHLWIIANSPAGEGWVMNSARTQNPLPVEFTPGKTVLFDTSGIADVERKLDETKSAL